MKALNKMKNEDVSFWLDKTLKSMGGAKSEQRKMELVDRYDDLKQEALARDMWHSWCEKHHFCPTHEGWDCFA